MRRGLWVLAVVLWLGGIGIVASVQPGLVRLERAEQELAIARQGEDPVAEAAALENLARIKPEKYSWQEAGEAYLTAGDPAAAMRSLQKAAETGKLNGTGRLLLGDLYLANGEESRALEEWQESIEQGELRGYERLAKYYRREKDWPELEVLLVEWMQAEEQNGEPFLQYSLLRSAQGNQAAMSDLRIAREKNPEWEAGLSRIENAILSGSFSAYLGFQPLLVGRVIGNLGSWDYAEIAFRQALELAPEYAEAWAFLSEARYQQQEGGEEEIQKALELNPDSVISQALYAMRLRREGKPEEALPYLERVAEIEPDQVVWRLEIAATLGELGMINEALAEFQKAVKLDPTNIQAWKQLTIFCIQHNLELRTIGLQAAREALSLAPEDAEALDLMGWTLFLLDDTTSAERFLHRAVEMDHQFVQAYLHLGQVYLKTQQNRLAYQHLKQARNLAVEGSESQMLASRLLERYFGEAEATP